MRLKYITELLTYILSNRFDLKLTLISYLLIYRAVVFFQKISRRLSNSLTPILKSSSSPHRLSSLSLFDHFPIISRLITLSQNTTRSHTKFQKRKMLLHPLRKLHTGQLFTFPPEPVGNFGVLRLLSRLGDPTLTKVPSRHILKTRRDG